MELPQALEWEDPCLFEHKEDQPQTQIIPVISQQNCLELLEALAQGNAVQRYFDNY